MKIILLTLSALTLTAAAARAEAEGAGNPFPFAVPALTIMSPAYAIDTGSAAYPNLTGRASHTAVAGGLDTLLANGAEGTVQTANALPRGALDGTVAFVQAQSVARFFAGRDGRTHFATQHIFGDRRG